MNDSSLFRSFLNVHALYFLPEIWVHPSITRTLGHTVITTPIVLDFLNGIDIPYILADYGDIVDDEITGAIITGEDGFMQEHVSLMTSQTGWMARAKVLVVTWNPNVYFFRYLWNEGVMNVVLLTKRGYFAYNPFNDTMFSLDGMDIEKALDERWRDMYGHHVTVAMYRHHLSFRTELGISLGSGIDGSALYELAKHWNMTVHLVDTGKYHHFVHLTDFLLNLGRVDLSMNARFLSREKKYINKPDHTSPIYADTIVIVLKIPDKLRGWAIFGRIFQRAVWLSLVGALVVMNRTILWIGKVTSLPRSVWSALKALCNIPISRPPQSNPARIVLVAGFMVGMVMVTIFQASLYHSIKEGVTYERMESIPQVIHNFQLVTDSETTKAILHKYERGKKKLTLEMKVMDLNDEVFEKYAFVTRAMEVKLLIETGELRGDLYNVDEAVCAVPLSYVVKRGSPYLNRLSDFTSRVFEGGLWSVWYQMTLHRLSRGQKKIDKEQEHKVLSLRDVEAAFVVLVLGYLISTTVFLLELLIKAIHQGKLRRLRRYIRIFLNFMYPTE